MAFDTPTIPVSYYEALTNLTNELKIVKSPASFLEWASSPTRDAARDPLTFRVSGAQRFGAISGGTSESRSVIS